MKTWLDACDEFARHRGIATSISMLLRAFADPLPRGGPPPAPERLWSDDFEALEADLLARGDLARIATDLRDEVDAAQAEMFERRIRAVDRFLEDQRDATARLLRVGLRQRLAGIRSARRPWAARVRALADYYYSHASRHHHRCSMSGTAPTLHEAVANVQFTTVIEGLERAHIEEVTQDGPMHVNILRADPRAIRVRMADTRVAVERGVAFEEHVQALGAVAAVSGGFFLYSEPDIEPPSRRFDPVGLLIADGQVVSPPALARCAVAASASGELFVEPIGLTGVELRLDSGRAWVVEEVFNRAHGSTAPDRRCIAVVGDVVVNRGRTLKIPLNGFVTPLPDGITAHIGERVQWGPVCTSSGAVVQDAIAGGPMLVHGGRVHIDLRAEDFWGTAPPVTFSQDETGDQNLLPRMAAGVDRHGRLLLAAVDGRNLERALGMTLRDLANLMVALDCHTATNLDGGSSKRMVLRGEALDLPSTEIVDANAQPERIRPVHTAILLLER